MKYARVFGAIMTAGLVVAGCGSDGDASSTATGATSATPAPTTAATDSTTAESVASIDSSVVTETSAPETTAAPALSGDPVKIEVFVDLVAPNLGGGYPEIPAAMNAAVDAVNASGGVNGHELQLEVCDTKSDPNAVASCARAAADDKSVVAVVGSFIAVGSPLDVLEPAGVPFFGQFPVAVQDFSSTVSYPLQGGPIVDLFCVPHLAADVIKPTPTKISFAHTGIPALAALEPLLAGEAGKLGITVDPMVPMPPNAPDLSPQVAAATGSEAVALGATNSQVEQFLTTAAATGNTKPIIESGSLRPTSIKKLGDVVEGLYQCDSIRIPTPDFPGGQQFLDETKDIKDLAVASSSIGAWVAVHAFVDIASKLQTVDRASFLAALPTLNAVDTYGFTDPVDFTTPYAGLGGKFPHLFGRDGYYFQIKDGVNVGLNEDPVKLG